MIARRTTPRPKALWKQVREQIDGPEPEKPKKLIVRRPKAKPGTAGTGYWPRKRIRHKSKRKVRIDKLYMIVRNAFLVLNPIDVYVYDGSSHATEIHHRQGRGGTLYLDWRLFAPVSRKTHNWIGMNIEEARRKGMICAHGLWNQAPADEITKELESIMAETSFSKAKAQFETLLRANGLLGNAKASSILFK